MEDLPGTVAVMGLGYSVDALARLPWAAHAYCLYWGDIDTHGYAILHHARGALPTLTSVEHAMYDALRRHTWGQGVRLEQERIAWDHAWPLLLTAITLAPSTTRPASPPA